MILDLTNKLPTLNANALAIVGERNEDLTHQLTEMATAKLDQRLARALLRLAAQTGRAVTGGVEISVPLLRQDLAEIAGTDLFSVSRLLRRWTDQGMIIARRLHVTVLDPVSLKTVAGKSD